MPGLDSYDPTPGLIERAEQGYAEDGIVGSISLEKMVFDILWIAGHRRGENLPRIVEKYCHWHNDYYRRIREDTPE